MKLWGKIAKIYSDFDNAGDYAKTQSKSRTSKKMKKETERPITKQQWKKDSNGNIIFSYDKEKQTALRKWCQKLEAVISGKAQGKIIQLQK